MVVYQFQDYREYFKNVLPELKRSRPGFNLSNLAKACGIQSPYLSKVLRGDADFSQDQLFLAGEYISLGNEEIQYLILLLDHAKTQQAKRKRALTAKIEAIQNQFRQTKKHIIFDELHAAELGRAEYFLDPYLQLIYAALTISKYRKDPKKICRAIGLSRPALDKGLAKLESFGMIRKDGGDWLVNQSYFHITKEDPLCRPYQHILKLKSIEQIMKLPPSAYHSFVWTISMDEKTKLRIEEEFLKFVKKVNVWVHEAPSENLYQLNFDLFPWETGDGQ